MMREQPCPRDGTALQRQTVGPAEIRLCSRCAGLWIRGEDLESFLRSPFESWKLHSLQGDGPPAVVHETVQCTCVGRSAMSTVTRDGVIIDVCPTCHAVWLDGGELEALLQRAGTEPRESRPNRVKGALDVLVDILSAVV